MMFRDEKATKSEALHVASMVRYPAEGFCFCFRTRHGGAVKDGKMH